MMRVCLNVFMLVFFCVWLIVSPKFSVLPKNPTIVNEGASVALDCVVEGDPKPTIQWDRNLKMNDFDKSRYYKINSRFVVLY